VGSIVAVGLGLIVGDDVTAIFPQLVKSKTESVNEISNLVLIDLPHIGVKDAYQVSHLSPLLIYGY
jgi:hypothetical protein